METHSKYTVWQRILLSSV